MLLEFFLTHSTTLKMRREEQINREGFYHFLCDVVIFIFIFLWKFYFKTWECEFFFFYLKEHGVVGTGKWEGVFFFNERCITSFFILRIRIN